jgi:transcriptional regulator with XRE-family HTH domain
MNLKQARLFMGWTQVELSERLRTSQPLINFWENGKVPIPSERQHQLEALFGIPITINAENDMKIQNKEAYENGKRKALAEIQARLDAKFGNSESSSSQTITNARFTGSAPPQRSSRARLGFGTSESESAAAHQAFENSLRAGKIRVQTKNKMPSGGQVTHAADCFPGLIPTPTDIRDALNRNREARAELHRVTIENRAQARRRLGLGNQKSALMEKLAAALLDEDAPKSPLGPTWHKDEE